MGILISHSTIYMFRNWLIAFMLFELAKFYAQIQVHRTIREDEVALTGISLPKKALGFAINQLSFAWFLYGNVLYYSARPQPELGVIFSSLFCSLLIYGYTYMFKHVLECAFLCVVSPLWYCLYPSSEIYYNLSSVQFFVIQ